MKGYKVFNPDFTCRGMQYEVGKTYKLDGPLEMCKNGFHFCLRVADCFNYYAFNPHNKVAEIEASGRVETEGDKSVTDEITIVREISWDEMLALTNSGKGNTGLENTGDRNSGRRNSGSCNTGNRNSGHTNSGYWNSGSRNTGDYNRGDCNSGRWNSGDCNSGDCNSGNWNSGDWNSGDWNSGFFSTITPKVDLFEKPTDMTREQILDNPGIVVLNRHYKNNWWVYSEVMTDEEKAAHPEYKRIGGYIKSIPFKDACALMWKNLTADEKRMVIEIPNFDPDIFYRITGIDVKNDNMIGEKDEI